MKITSLREILSKAPIDILCLDGTKIDSGFPDAPFKINGYQYSPTREGGNSKVGGKILFVRLGIIAKRLTNIETKTAEAICIEFKISKNSTFFHISSTEI